MSRIIVDSLRGNSASSDAITLDSGGKATYAATSGTSNFTISDGDLVIGTAGHGIDFSATSGTGTSELLDDYEEGTWTPTESGGLSLTVYVANYIKVGRIVYIETGLLVPTNSDGGGLQFGGLPYTAVSSGDNTGGFHLTSTNSGRHDTFFAIRNNTLIGVATTSNLDVARSAYSNKQLKICGSYISAS